MAKEGANKKINTHELDDELGLHVLNARPKFPNPGISP